MFNPATLRPLRWAAIPLVVLNALFAAGLGFVYAGDERSPTAETLSVKESQRDEPLTQMLVIRLTRPANQSAIQQALRTAPPTEGILSSSHDRRAFTWTPSGLLKDLTRYTITLGSFKDATGHSVKPSVWHFTTAILPRVISIAASNDTPLD